MCNNNIVVDTIKSSRDGVKNDGSDMVFKKSDRDGGSEIIGRLWQKFRIKGEGHSVALQLPFEPSRS